MIVKTGLTNIRVEIALIILCTVLLNILIWLYFTFEIDLADYQRGFYLQIVFSLIVNCILSGFCIAFRKTKVFFLIKYFFIIVILYPLNKYMYFNMLIHFEFILLVILIVKFPFGTAASVMSILFQLILKTENIMGRAANESHIKVTLYIAGFSLILILILTSIKLLIRTVNKQHTGIEHDKDFISKLTEIALQSQVYATEAEEKSRQKERKRLIRDIHDIVGYTLVNVSVMMELCIDYFNNKKNDELIKQIEKVKSHVREGHEQLRYSLRTLSMFYEETLKGIAAYKKVINTFRDSTGIVIDVEFTNVKFEYSLEIDIFIIRLLQEGLINSYRHGRSTRVNIHFFEAIFGSDNHLIISIRDNGKGADDYVEGIGFRGMKERVLNLNGEITFSNVNEGFQIRAKIPLSGVKE